MISYAILKDRKVIPVKDVLEWANWFEKFNRTIGRMIVPGKGTVSTIFLGHNMGVLGENNWFETMVFGGKFDGYCDRYETLEQAEKGHQRVVQCLYSNIDPELDNQGSTN